MINVNFRVVGIYFGCYPGDADSTTGQITVQVNDNPTVYDVMKAVAQKVEDGAIPGVESFGFTPSPAYPDQSINSIIAKYSENPRKNRDYGPGVYVLEEANGSNPSQVLQYYIISENGVQTNNHNEHTPFTNFPEVPIGDGDTIIWRQVSICIGPNGGYRSANRAKSGLAKMNRS